MNVRYDDFMFGEGGSVPDYSDYYVKRTEETRKWREQFRNEMQPTIHVQMQVRKIAADHYEDALRVAFEGLVANEETRIMLGRLGIGFLRQFVDAARVAKEANGTYTVTLP